MAERRMFAKSVVTSDAFLDMSFSARCLYFALGMYADDDGFVDSPKSVMRQSGATQDDINELISNRFVIPFESGVIVITHWNVNNNLRKDRYKPTLHAAEHALLRIENGIYIPQKTDCQPNDNQATTICQPNDNQVSPFGCIGEYRLGKASIGKDSIGKASTPAHAPTHTRESFCEAYGIAADAEPPTDMDFDKLTEAYSSSTLLRNPEKPYFRSMKWIIKNYSDIVAGKYKDFSKSKTAPPPKPSGKHYVEIDK